MEAGPSYRHIVDLSNILFDGAFRNILWYNLHMDNSQFIIPMGQSGNLLDKNYANLLDDFLNDRYLMHGIFGSFIWYSKDTLAWKWKAIQLTVRWKYIHK